MKRLALALLLALPLSVMADDELTILELQGRVQQLLAQITAIQLELQVAEANRVPDRPACPDISRTLRTGVMGNDVRALQRYLMQTGDFATGDTTAYFGPKTEAAVGAFQCRELGLCDPSEAGYGVVGPRTRAAIREACESGISQNSGGDTPLPRTGANGSLCGQPPVPSCGEGQSCILSLPAARTYPDAASLSADGAVLIHAGACACGDNGIACHETDAAACSFWGQRVAHGETIAAFRQGIVASVSLCESEARSCANGVLSGSYAYATCVAQ